MYATLGDPERYRLGLRQDPISATLWMRMVK